MTVGLHTGIALAGNIGAPGRVNYTTIGDTVNTAQRIERLSRDLDFPESDVTILVSASTAKAMGGGLEPFTAGSHVLRGRGEPIEVYRIA
jgi:class 3 adenylate cyclase